jgi:hypothetical protein
VHLPEDPGHTYHGFQGPFHQTDKGKIDWILVRGQFFVEDAEIIRDNENNRFPSDHYFVQADVVLKSGRNEMNFISHSMERSELSETDLHHCFDEI